MLDKAKLAGLIHGMMVGKDNVEVSHLQFADDTLLFLQGFSTNVFNAMKLVECYCEMSGLVINKEKSQNLGVNMDSAVVSQMANGIGCETGGWPMKYLGMPLGGNPLRDDFWEPFLQKISKRLGGWKRGFLSKGGQFILIQSVLSALPTYYMSMFKVPVKVISLMEKAMKCFFWEKMEGEGRQLASWKSLGFPKTEGGLEIGNLK